MTEHPSTTSETTRAPAVGVSGSGNTPAEARPTRRTGGRPKKTGPCRTERLEVLLTPAEKAEMVRTAEQANLSVAELVRRRVLGRPVQSKTDAEARRSLRRIGGNLNQIARRVNAAGTVGGTAAGLAADVAAGVAELRAAVARLMRGAERGAEP